jgi:hypothetical protein
MSDTARTRQAEGGQPSVPDQQELPGADSSPYVPGYIRPDMLTRVVCWLAMAGRSGTWALLTTADWETGDWGEWFLPLERRALFGPRDVPGEMLTTWVREVLGCPVTLEPDTARLLPGRHKSGRRTGQALPTVSGAFARRAA